jgi:DNA-binding NtrC family response regulator
MLGEKRVLIVDDEVVIADSLARVFSVNGYDSKAAYSVEGAIQAVSEWTPRLAIIDVRLREINGVDFAVQLREKFPCCEVALFTGLSDLSDLLERTKDAGHAFEVISKPIHPKDILGIAARILAALEDGEFSIARTAIPMD